MVFSQRMHVQRSGRCSVVVRASAITLPPKFSAVKPSGDRVLVKVGEAEAKTVGGILLPTAAVTKKTEGAVAAVGTVKSAIKAGDQVVYSRYAGAEVKIGDEEHVIMKEADVIGIKGDSIADMKPLQDRILIRLSEEQMQSTGGVLLTSQSTEKPTIGTVVAVGPGMSMGEGADEKFVAVTIPVGAEVFFSKYSGIELEDGDVKYVVVREAEVLAVLS